MKLGKYVEWSIYTGHRHGFSINKLWVALNSWPNLMVGVCITWRCWESYSFDVQSAHRKSRFSEHSRSEAPRQLLGSELQVFLQGPGLYQLSVSGTGSQDFLPSLSLTWMHVSAQPRTLQGIKKKPLFLHSFIFWRDLEHGVNGVVGVICRVLFNQLLGWFVGKGALSKPTFTDKGGDLVSMPWNCPPFC